MPGLREGLGWPYRQDRRRERDAARGHADGEGGGKRGCRIEGAGPVHVGTQRHVSGDDGASAAGDNAVEPRLRSGLRQRPTAPTLFKVHGPYCQTRCSSACASTTTTALLRASAPRGQAVPFPGGVQVASTSTSQSTTPLVAHELVAGRAAGPLTTANDHWP